MKKRRKHKESNIISWGVLYPNEKNFAVPFEVRRVKLENQSSASGRHAPEFGQHSLEVNNIALGFVPTNADQVNPVQSSQKAAPSDSDLRSRTSQSHESLPSQKLNKIRRSSHRGRSAST